MSDFGIVDYMSSVFIATLEEVDGAGYYLPDLSTDSLFIEFVYLDHTLISAEYNSDLLNNMWCWWLVRTFNCQTRNDYSLVWSFLVDYDSTIVDFVPGDANGGGYVRGNEVTILMNYLKGSGSALDIFFAGDANEDCQIIGNDLTYITAYFKGSGNPSVRGDCSSVINKPPFSAEKVVDG